MKMRVLLLSCLLLTRVCSSSGAVFVYSALGGEAVLPCPSLKSSGCSLVSWTFFRGNQVNFTLEVSGGRVRAESGKAGRASLDAGCALRLRDLRPDDAGSYICSLRDARLDDAYLSLLSVRPGSSVWELRPGGRLVLSCVLATYYDAGSCKPYTDHFNLSWAGPDGAPLTASAGYELVSPSRCNVTLTAQLGSRDDNRKWRCQVRPKGSDTVAFQDFTSVFLFHAGGATVDRATPASPITSCPAESPWSRVALVVALPLMVAAVGFLTYWKDRPKTSKTSTEVIELREA